MPYFNQYILWQLYLFYHILLSTNEQTYRPPSYTYKYIYWIEVHPHWNYILVEILKPSTIKWSVFVEILILITPMTQASRYIRLYVDTYCSVIDHRRFVQIAPPSISLDIIHLFSRVWRVGNQWCCWPLWS